MKTKCTIKVGVASSNIFITTLFHAIVRNGHETTIAFTTHSNGETETRPIGGGLYRTTIVNRKEIDYTPHPDVLLVQKAFNEQP